MVMDLEIYTLKMFVFNVKGLCLIIVWLVS